MKRHINALIVTLTLCMTAAGCSGSKTETALQTDAISQTASEASTEISAENIQTITGEMTTEATAAAYTSYTAAVSDIDGQFTERDLLQTADTSGAETLTAADGKTIEITKEGVYIISGTAKNCTVKVSADESAKVQLVLKDLNITNTSTPAIYIVSTDKCFITTEGENSLSVTGTFTADGSTNTDAVIYAKDDIVLNGTGTLNISSAQGNGITGKDDLKVTGGTYNITSALDGIEANDSVRISGGSFAITSSKDGIHSENSDDDTTGYIYISDGSFKINAASDCIQGTTAVQIDGGTFDLTGAEGIEGTYVQINGGTININASDDGINAANKSKSFGTPTVEFNGGTTTITMGQGDTDAVDANGNITVNGGTIDITAQVSSFDYDGTAKFNGGTIIINGTEVSAIPQAMMGGRGGMGGFGGMGGRGGQNGGFGTQQAPVQNGDDPGAQQAPAQNGELPQFGSRPDFENGEMPQFGSRPYFEQNGEMPENGFGGKGRGGRRNFTQNNTGGTENAAAGTI